jgi:hypothetical protein
MATGATTWSPDRTLNPWRAVLSVQAVYYGLTGVWPLVSINSFQAVTGPKTDHLVTGRESDHWLVLTVGVLVTAIGLSLLASLRRQRPSFETAILALSAALGLTCIDVIYVSRGVLLPIYLVDAAPEILFMLAWSWYLVQERHSLLTEEHHATRQRSR